MHKIALGNIFYIFAYLCNIILYFAALKWYNIFGDDNE